MSEKVHPYSAMKSEQSCFSEKAEQYRIRARSTLLYIYEQRIQWINGHIQTDLFKLPSLRRKKDTVKTSEKKGAKKAEKKSEKTTKKQAEEKAAEVKEEKTEKTDKLR